MSLNLYVRFELFDYLKGNGSLLFIFNEIQSQQTEIQIFSNHLRDIKKWKFSNLHLVIYRCGKALTSQRTECQTECLTFNNNLLDVQICQIRNYVVRTEQVHI